MVEMIYPGGKKVVECERTSGWIGRDTDGFKWTMNRKTK
jgi:hypothetical protein